MPDTTAVTSHDDLRNRWVPTPRQYAIAAAIMAADPTVSDVIVPLALPGKEHGIWEIGQVVLEVPGFFPVSESTALNYRDARDLADATAAEFMGDEEGESSYAIIHCDGTASTFEGCARGMRT